MAPYCNRAELEDYLRVFEGQDPVKAVTCAFAQDSGAGMGMAIFALFVFALVGLGLTIRTRHPSPIIVTTMLSVGVATFALPGIAAEIVAIVLIFSIGALGMYLYARAQSTL